MITHCKICKLEFYSKPSHIKKGWGIYCSIRCKSIGTCIKRQKVTCFICKKSILRTALQIKHSKSGKFFCNKSCQTKWRNKEFSGQKHLSWKDGKSMYRKILRKSSIPLVCTLCGEKDKRVLAVHHIDKNRKNSEIKNLVWLCHNCHSLVHYDRVEGQMFLAKQSKK
jgi:hypothetical protein